MISPDAPPMVALLLPSFSDGQRLWGLLIIPLLVIAYLWVLRRKNLTGMRFTNTGVLARVLPKQSSWRRHVAVAATLLSLAALMFAWARPEGVEKVPRERATVVMVIDVSHSMAAKDVKPDRLSAAKKAANEFILTLPPEFNVAVVALSGKPEVRLPPTTDRGAAQRIIDQLEMQDATAIGGAIDSGLEAIKQAPPGPDNKPAPAVMVLLSDGQNTEGGSPIDAAAKAKAQKVKVYTIAYGTETGYVDLDGKRERVAPDKALLAKVAADTGAKSWTADSAKDLSSVYKDVKGEVGYEEVKREITAQWAFYAFAFAVIAGLGAVSMAARWPS